MILKILKWFLLTAVVLILGLMLVLQIGSSRSLDQNKTYSKTVSTLPVFSAQSSSQLVRIKANGFEYRARIAGFGGDDKPAVVLLHGFPVSSAMWVPLIEALELAGYRVLAFDQRGYSPGARPGDSANYTVDKLREDVMAVTKAVGLQQFHLIGHDWGAVVGWNVVMEYPQNILSWTALSIAHPAAFAEALENDPDQKSRSSYFMFFVTPWLPEVLFSFNDFKMLRSFYQNMSEQQQTEYLTLFSEDGALTAALNWYRALMITMARPAEMASKVDTSTLFIWGNKDTAVGRYGVEAQVQYMTGPFREVELNAGHWLLEDQPKAIIENVLQHLAQ